MPLGYERGDLRIDEESGLNRFDLGRSSIIRRGSLRGRPIPLFALGDSLRTVLAARAWSYLHSWKPIPPNVVDYWKLLDVQCSAYAAARHRQNPTCPKARDMWRIANFAGTYLSGQAAIAWFAWRCGESNGDIAERFGLSYGQVAQALASIVVTAKRLGLPTYQPGPLHGRYKGGKRKTPLPQFGRRVAEVEARKSASMKAAWERQRERLRPRWERAQQLRQAGLTLQAIADELKTTRSGAAKMLAKMKRPGAWPGQNQPGTFYQAAL